MQSLRGIVASTGDIIHTFLRRNPQNANKVAQFLAQLRTDPFISDFLDAIAKNTCQLKAAKELSRAIREGEHAAHIFSDPNCYLYLIYIIGEEWIAFEHGMTVYFYLMALQQFTKQQPLAPEHESYQSLRELSVVSLMQGQELTVEGAKFLRSMADDLACYTKKNCYEDFIQFVKQLPPCERWLLRMPFSPEVSNLLSWKDYQEDVKRKGFDILLDKVLRYPPLPQSVPYFQIDVQPNHQAMIFNFPSQSIIRFCLQQLAENHLEPTYVMGSVDAAALHAHHRVGRQPVSLYAYHGQCKVVSVNNQDCGGFGVAVRDLVHLCWGSQMAHSFRKRIYDFLVPNFCKIIKIAEGHGDVVTAACLQNIIDQLGHFDFITVAEMTPDMQIAEYLAHVLTNAGFYRCNGQSRLGCRQFDAIYFLLQQVRWQHESWTPEERRCWAILISRVQPYIDVNRGIQLNAPTMSAILTRLAKESVRERPLGEPLYSNHRINWPAWLDILYSTTDSAEIWERVLRDHHAELLVLIKKSHLNFYHPYLPMTAVKRQELISFLRSEWLNVVDARLEVPVSRLAAHAKI